MKTVLFICVHNAGRSQMAEAFFNHLAEGKALGISAGTDPATAVNPVVVQAMLEVGLDISQNKPKTLTVEMLDQAERVVTMGCNTESTCPATFVPAEDWALEDPNGKSLEQVKRIRDNIRDRVVKLVTDIQ